MRGFLYVLVTIIVCPPFAVAAQEQQGGITPEQAEQMREQQAKVEQYNRNIGAVNVKLKAATAAVQATPPNYDSAIALLKEASQMVPNEDLVWFRLGGTYLDSAKTITDSAEKTSRYTEAYNCLQRAIDLKKSKIETPGAQPAAENQKMAAYDDNFGAAAARVGKPEEAVNAYEEAIKLDPSHAGHYYFNLGAVLTNSNTTNDVNIRKRAVDAFDKAIAADPNDPLAQKARQMLAALNTTVENSPAKKGIASQIASPPLSLADIEHGLKAGVTNTRMTALVKQYGVDFEVTDAVEKQLRAVGANGDLLLEISRSKPSR